MSREFMKGELVVFDHFEFVGGLPEFRKRWDEMTNHGVVGADKLNYHQELRTRRVIGRVNEVDTYHVYITECNSEDQFVVNKDGRCPKGLLGITRVRDIIGQVKSLVQDRE